MYSTPHTAIGMGMYADANQLMNSLRSFQWLYLLPVLGLTFVNYVLRYAKWHYYLRRLGIQVSHKDSALVFFSGLSMAITPGKFGELFKAVLLRDRAQVAETDTASVVIAERLTDFIALIILATFGVFSAQHGYWVLAISVIGTAFALVLVSSRRAENLFLGILERFSIGRRIAPKLRKMLRSIASLTEAKPLLLMTTLSVVAWFCECIGYYWILCGIPGTQPDLGTATFIYAFATIFGAIAMLPGGLGVTEGSLIGLSHKVFAVAPGPLSATAAAMLIRFCTLWFAVIVGLIAYGAHRLFPSRPVDNPSNSSKPKVSVDTPSAPERESATNT